MIVKIAKEEVERTLGKILLAHDFSESKASRIAETFTRNSLEGVYSHGVNRFGRFMEDVRKGHVIKDAEPIKKTEFNAVEQWDGQHGPGILNAHQAVDQAIQLSRQFGIGCVALANTNHWMRGGTYGRVAAEKGCIFIGWTNTIANLPAWGAIDCKLGNNPLVMAVPGNPPVVLDMAMSQYSYGKLEDKVLKNEELPIVGGYDSEGHLTTKPKEILESGRPLPIGYWKGAGLSLVLDLLAAILSDGLSTADISERDHESSVSQVFIAIDPSTLGRRKSLAATVGRIIDDYKKSIPESDQENIIFPGERSDSIVQENLTNGIPIPKKVWDEILNIN